MSSSGLLFFTIVAIIEVMILSTLSISSEVETEKKDDIVHFESSPKGLIPMELLFLTYKPMIIP